MEIRTAVKTLLQVLVGLLLNAATGYVLIYDSKIPLLWEHEEPLDPVCTRPPGGQDWRWVCCL